MLKGLVVTALSGPVQVPGHETETWPANMPRRGRTGQYRAAPCLALMGFLNVFKWRDVASVSCLDVASDLTWR